MVPTDEQTMSGCSSSLMIAGDDQLWALFPRLV
jgi:hypothetical protein